MKISIIGLGWLGLPLARSLAEQGHHILGSTTSNEKHQRLLEEGLENVVFRLEPHPVGRDFNRLFEAELVIINIPPKRRSNPATFHPEQIKYLKSLLEQAGVNKVIYTSSTSTYPDANQSINEDFALNAENTGNITMYQAEKLLLDSPVFQTSIIRFGGLLGVDRVPGRYFSGKDNVDGQLPANYIHQADAVRMIAHLIEKGLWGKVYNGVCPSHPAKREIYEQNALDLGFAPPRTYKENQQSPWKIVDSEAILSTGFEFLYQSPLDFTYVEPK